jgi:hypothetical protein
LDRDGRGSRWEAGGSGLHPLRDRVADDSKGGSEVTSSTHEAAADAIAQRLTRAECEGLAHLLDRSADALDFLAEVSHPATDEAESYRDDAEQLRELGAIILVSEERYRDE